jgi:hypothetical protein
MKKQTTTQKDDHAKPNPRKKLSLAKETVRLLTTDELRSVAGGMSTGSRFC